MKLQLVGTTWRPKTRITFFDLFRGGQKVISSFVREKEYILTLHESCPKIGGYHTV